MLTIVAAVIAIGDVGIAGVGLASLSLVVLCGTGVWMAKVDENLPNEVCHRLNRAGHDATSVGEHGLGGADDARIYHHCQAERRALITLDVDFANARAYDPKSSAGVIVLRLAQQDRQRVLDAVASILPILAHEPLKKRLWIVEEERIRIRA